MKKTKRLFVGLSAMLLSVGPFMNLTASAQEYIEDSQAIETQAEALEQNEPKEMEVTVVENLDENFEDKHEEYENSLLTATIDTQITNDGQNMTDGPVVQMTEKIEGPTNLFSKEDNSERKFIFKTIQQLQQQERLVQQCLYQ